MLISETFEPKRHDRIFAEWRLAEAEPGVGARANVDLDDLRAVLDLLPPVEADVVDLFIFRGKTQTDIAWVMGGCQASVSYQVRKALGRAKIHIEHRDVTDEQVRQSIEASYFQRFEKLVLAAYWLRRGCSQTEAGRRSGLRQSSVSDFLHRFVQRGRNPRVASYYKALHRYSAPVTRPFVRRVL